MQKECKGITKTPKFGIKTDTVFQSDAGLFGVDIVENALVSDLTLGSQAYQAAEVGIGGRIRSRSRCRIRTILRSHSG